MKNIIKDLKKVNLKYKFYILSAYFIKDGFQIEYEIEI